MSLSNCSFERQGSNPGREPRAEHRVKDLEHLLCRAFLDEFRAIRHEIIELFPLLRVASGANNLKLLLFAVTLEQLFCFAASAMSAVCRFQRAGLSSLDYS